MTAQTDANAFLMGSSARSAKFEIPGTTIGGKIVSEPQMRQQTEYVKGGGQGKPLFWDNGDPKMQLVVKVQTDLREDTDDDGVRAFYCRGGFKRATTQKAVADAVRAAGAQGLAVGGELYLTFVSKDGPGDDDAKNFTARYVPPVVASGFLQQGGAVPAATSTALPTPPPPAPAEAAQQVAPPPPAPVAPAAPAGMVTLPDGSQVTAEVAALLAQVAPQTASA